MNPIPVNSNILKGGRQSINFDLPKNLECSKPTEERGIRRDEVRLMVSHYQDDRFHHTQFQSIGEHLQAGDVLVFNTSATLPAALSATNKMGKDLRVHLSTQRSEDYWVIEIREVTATGATQRYHGSQSKEFLTLKEGGSLELVQPYYANATEKEHLQLWIARFHLAESTEAYLNKNGKPIRYGYQKKNYPLAYYQTVFAREKGSAEMPSAGRAFTESLVTQLVTQGIHFAPLLLHTGVASLELAERPYEEFYQVPSSTAQLVNLARAEGRRIIAVGTTAIRALETVTNIYGETQGGSGWTDTFITPQRGHYGIDGLITGFHEPKASHLLMLETLSGRSHLELSYQLALQEKYQWHEFGDLHLLLP